MHLSAPKCIQVLTKSQMRSDAFEFVLHPNSLNASFEAQHPNASGTQMQLGRVKKCNFNPISIGLLITNSIRQQIVWNL